MDLIRRASHCPSNSKLQTPFHQDAVAHRGCPVNVFRDYSMIAHAVHPARLKLPHLLQSAYSVERPPMTTLPRHIRGTSDPTSTGNEVFDEATWLLYYGWRHCSAEEVESVLRFDLVVFQPCPYYVGLNAGLHVRPQSHCKSRTSLGKGPAQRGRSRSA